MMRWSRAGTDISNCYRKKQSELFFSVVFCVIQCNSCSHIRKNPNFLLCNELQHYLSSPEGKKILLSVFGNNRMITEDRFLDYPALSTLKKGCLALIRQWASLYAGVILASNDAHATGQKVKRNIPNFTEHSNMEQTTETDM